METVLIVIHLMVVLALVVVVLLQRSEGGALGIGGGGGFMSSRGQANALTRATGILAAAFFATSLALALLASHGRTPSSIINRNAPAGGATAPAGAPPAGGTMLDQLRGNRPQGTEAPAQPASPAPAAPAAPTQPAPPAAPN